MRSKRIRRALCALLLALVLASLGSCTQRPGRRVTIVQGGEVICGCEVCRRG